MTQRRLVNRLNVPPIARSSLRPDVSQVELVDLRNHLRDALPNQLALFAQGADLGRRRGGLAQAGTRGVQLALQPGNFVGGLRALVAQRVDHADELADFFFETVNGLHVSRGRGSGHQNTSRKTVRTEQAVPARLARGGNGDDATIGRIVRSRLSAAQRRLVVSGERMDDGLDCLLDLRVRQGAIGVLEREPDRQADLALRHAFTVIPIELAH